MARRKKEPAAGRPTKLDEDVQERVCEALRQGNFRSVAANYAGISQRTLREWMAAGRAEKEGPHRDFRRAVLEAEGEAERKAVALVMRAAESDPKHAEWWLTHRHAERWAENRKVKVSGEVKTSPLEKVSTERLVELAGDGDT